MDRVIGYLQSIAHLEALGLHMVKNMCVDVGLSNGVQECADASISRQSSADTRVGPEDDPASNVGAGDCQETFVVILMGKHRAPYPSNMCEI